VAALFVTNELIDLPTKPLIEVIDHSNCTRELNKLMHLYHAVLLCHFVYYHFIINTIAWKLKSWKCININSRGTCLTCNCISCNSKIGEVHTYIIKQFPTIACYNGEHDVYDVIFLFIILNDQG